LAAVALESANPTKVQGPIRKQKTKVTPGIGKALSAAPRQKAASHARKRAKPTRLNGILSVRCAESKKNAKDLGRFLRERD
jgi:hypothetical protein